MTSEAFSKHCARDSNSTQLHFAFLSLASSDINEDTLETENAAAAAAAAFTASTHLKEAVLGRSELQLMGLGSSGAAESWGGTYCCVAGLGVLLHPCLPSEVLFGVPSMGDAALHQGCTPAFGEGRVLLLAGALLPSPGAGCVPVMLPALGFLPRKDVMLAFQQLWFQAKVNLESKGAGAGRALSCLHPQFENV